MLIRKCVNNKTKKVHITHFFNDACHNITPYIMEHWVSLPVIQATIGRCEISNRVSRKYVCCPDSRHHYWSDRESRDNKMFVCIHCHNIHICSIECTQEVDGVAVCKVTGSETGVVYDAHAIYGEHRVYEKPVKRPHKSLSSTTTSSEPAAAVKQRIPTYKLVEDQCNFLFGSHTKNIERKAVLAKIDERVHSLISNVRTPRPIETFIHLGQTELKPHIKHTAPAISQSHVDTLNPMPSKLKPAITQFVDNTFDKFQGHQITVHHYILAVIFLMRTGVTYFDIEYIPKVPWVCQHTDILHTYTTIKSKKISSCQRLIQTSMVDHKTRKPNKEFIMPPINQ